MSNDRYLAHMFVNRIVEEHTDDDEFLIIKIAQNNIVSGETED